MGFQRVTHDWTTLTFYISIYLSIFLSNLHLSTYLYFYLFIISYWFCFWSRLMWSWAQCWVFSLSLLIHQQSWVQHWLFLFYKLFTWFSGPVPSLMSPPLPFRIHSLLTLHCLWLCVCDLLCWFLLSTWRLITGVTNAQTWEFSPFIYLYILTLMVVSSALRHVCMLRTSASTSPAGLFQNSDSTFDSWLIMSTWTSSSLIVTWHISGWVLLSTSTHNNIPSFCYSALPLQILGPMGLVQDTPSF